MTREASGRLRGAIATKLLPSNRTCGKEFSTAAYDAIFVFRSLSVISARPSSIPSNDLIEPPRPLRTVRRGLGR